MAFAYPRPPRPQRGWMKLLPGGLKASESPAPSSTSFPVKPHRPAMLSTRRRQPPQVGELHATSSWRTVGAQCLRREHGQATPPAEGWGSRRHAKGPRPCCRGTAPGARLSGQCREGEGRDGRRPASLPSGALTTSDGGSGDSGTAPVGAVPGGRPAGGSGSESPVEALAPHSSADGTLVEGQASGALGGGASPWRSAVGDLVPRMLFS